MSVNYTKLDVTSKEVVELAAKTKFPAKEVCAMLNNQRYRKAYNEMKQLREKLLKEALKEVDSVVEAKGMVNASKPKEVK